MIDIDLVVRLPLFRKRRNDPIESADFLFRNIQAAPRGRNILKCIEVVMLRIINIFQKRTLTDGFTTIADIGHQKSCHADFFQNPIPSVLPPTLLG